MLMDHCGPKDDLIQSVRVAAEFPVSHKYTSCMPAPGLQYGSPMTRLRCLSDHIKVRVERAKTGVTGSCKRLSSNVEEPRHRRPEIFCNAVASLGHFSADPPMENHMRMLW